MNKAKLANNLLLQKEEGFSISRSIRKSWKRLSFRLAILVIASYFYFSVAPNEAFLLVIGMLLGATLQDIGWIWRIGGNWSFTEEIINWDKVEEITKNNDYIG